MMRGAAGPVLCIGDLLSDVGESDASPPPQQHEPSPSSSSISSYAQSLDLTKLFQENYEQLNEALGGTDHSWAALTLKVGELEGVVKRADSAMAAARVVHGSLNKKEVPLDSNQNAK